MRSGSEHAIKWDCFASQNTSKLSIGTQEHKIMTIYEKSNSMYVKNKQVSLLMKDNGRLDKDVSG